MKTTNTSTIPNDGRCTDCGRKIAKDDLRHNTCAICHHAFCWRHQSRMHYICKACLANQPADVRAGLYGLRRQFALLIVPSMALIAIGLSFVMIELATGHSWILTIASMAFLLPGVVATIKLATWDQATFRARISTIALSPPRDQDLVV